MSNQVSDLYSSVIETVMREARSEFEESGDDPYILQTLKVAWKKRLMDMNISKRPLWSDPATESNSVTSSAAGASSLPSVSAENYPGSGGPNDIMLYNLQNKAGNLEGLSNLTSIPTQSSISNGLGSQQPFDILASNSQSAVADSGTQSSANPSMAYNPLSGKSMNNKDNNGAQFNISPELHAQLQNAMNKPEGSRYGEVPQHDGLDDELNSDLDDSEDELNSNDEEDDSDQTQLMLCLYEKVHKVKTRWKYTLKDGVANVNGLDYVFNKATGESEW